MCVRMLYWDNDITCADIMCEDLHLASLAGRDNITCDDLTFVYLNPDVCENVVLGLLI